MMRCFIYLNVMMIIYSIRASQLSLDHLPDEIACGIMVWCMPTFEDARKSNPAIKQQKVNEYIHTANTWGQSFGLLNSKWYALRNEVTHAAVIISRLSAALVLDDEPHQADELFFSLLLKLPGASDYFQKKMKEKAASALLTAELIERIRLNCPVIEKRHCFSQLYECLAQEYDLLLHTAISSYDPNMRTLVKLPTWVDDDHGRRRLKLHVKTTLAAWRKAEKTTDILDCMAVFKVMARSGLTLDDEVASYMFNNGIWPVPERFYDLT